MFMIVVVVAAREDPELLLLPGLMSIIRDTPEDE